jgi:hypothetical protein
MLLSSASVRWAFSVNMGRVTVICFWSWGVNVSNLSLSISFHYFTSALLKGCFDATIYDVYEINESVVLIVQTILLMQCAVMLHVTHHMCTFNAISHCWSASSTLTTLGYFLCIHELTSVEAGL